MQIYEERTKSERNQTNAKKDDNKVISHPAPLALTGDLHNYSGLPRRRQERKTLDKKNNTGNKHKKNFFSLPTLNCGPAVFQV